MGKAQKKQKSTKNKTKNKIVAKLISIEGGKKAWAAAIRRDRSAPNYLIADAKKQQEKHQMFSENTTVHPDGSVTTSDFMPSNENVKRTFIYQDLLKKYKRQQQKAHNKRQQLTVSRKNAQIDSVISKLVEQQYNKKIQFALMLLNRSRKKIGLEPILQDKFEGLFRLNAGYDRINNR